MTKYAMKQPWVCISRGMGGGGALPYKNGWSARRTFQGLKTWFWFLFACLDSKGSQRELLRYLLGY